MRTDINELGGSESGLTLGAPYLWNAADSSGSEVGRRERGAPDQYLATACACDWARGTAEDESVYRLLDRLLFAHAHGIICLPSAMKASVGSG